MKIFIKRTILILCTLLFITVKSNAQEINAINFLRDANASFEAKNYQDAIKKCDQGLILCSSNDSLSVELLYLKAFCHNRLNENKKAKSILKQALERCSLKNALYYRVACAFCRIFSYSSDNNENQLFEKHVVCLINDNHCLSKNLHNYMEYLLAKYGYEKNLNSNEIDNALMQERKSFDVENKSYLKVIHPFLEYVKAQLLCREYINTMGTYYRKNNSDDLSVYDKCVNGFLNLNTSVSNQFLSSCYKDMAELYEGKGDKMAAAIYLKRALDIQNVYWGKWGYKHPWLGYDDYIQLLADTRQYKSIVGYCNQLLGDDRLEKLGQSEIDEVKRIRDEAMSMLSDTVDDEFEAVSDELSNLIELYDKGTLTTQFIEACSGNDLDAFLNYVLYEKKDYKEILKMCRTVHEFLKNDRTGCYFTKDDVATGKCTQYDYELDCERDLWKHANANSTIWTTYYYTALAYLELGDYNNAVKYQKRVIDNVRTDWKYEQEERNELLKNYLKDRSSVISPLYWKTEIYMYCELARIYLCSKKYKEAYDVYTKAISINSQILKSILRTYSIDTRQEEWLNNNQVYENIIAFVSDRVDEYPLFSKLIIEASTMQKGFLLNQSRLLKELYSPEQRQNEKLLEKSNYVLSNNKEALIKRLADYDYNEWQTLDDNKILEKSTMSLDRLKTLLHDNDIFVDFFVVGTGNSINKNEVITRQLEDGSWIAGRTEWTFNDVRLYANVIRKKWNLPKVVYIGRLSDLISNKNTDILDYTIIHNSDQGYINELYSDTNIGNMIWGKIIKSAMASNEDNIYFIPGNIINKVAIENLAIQDGTVFSDCYKVHRISTVNEINKSSNYSKSDNCVAFGATTYSDYSNRAGKGSLKKEVLLNSDASALLDRKILAPLESSSSILTAIAECVPNAKLKLGKDANEQEFNKLDGNSSQILFLGTHGFCYNPSELSENQEEYLFGKYRDVSLLEEEKYMYASGLFMAQAKNPAIITDGVLTAKEVSMMDLRNTKLAILSACSTANGRMSNSEATYGLLRGFKMAGVQSILATLWDVDENATKLFMIEFFKYYTKGYNKSVAFKKAQQYLRSYKSNDVFNPVNYSSPYYWAGFILVD